jgi:nitrite reductase/ring-hydroxylating ferredoxin subunit
MGAGHQAPEPRAEQIADDVILVELAGRRVLASATCPHRNGRLSFGHLDQDKFVVRCPLHSSVFSLNDGRRVAGPACESLRIIAELPPGSPLPSASELRRLAAQATAAVGAAAGSARSVPESAPGTSSVSAVACEVRTSGLL